MAKSLSLESGAFMYAKRHPDDHAEIPGSPRARSMATTLIQLARVANTRFINLLLAAGACRLHDQREVG